MNVFENIRDKVLILFDKNGWVKWIHEGTPRAYDNEDKIANIQLSLKTNHCAKCLNINGCCFPRNNMPDYPLHFNCHCTLETITNINFKAECQLEKFTDYVFDPIKNSGKKNLFENLGYGKIDSEYLQKEYCRQAQEKYANGQFALNKLDDYGQRINIEITLQNKVTGGTVAVISGWMVYPNGKIQLTTPFGRKNK